MDEAFGKHFSSILRMEELGMVKYKLLDKQKEFIEIPHSEALDVAIYQGGYGSGKTWCGSLLGILLAKKYPGSRGLVGAKEYELVRKLHLFLILTT